VVNNEIYKWNSKYLGYKDFLDYYKKNVEGTLDLISKRTTTYPPKPFIWMATVEHILANSNCCKAILDRALDRRGRQGRVKFSSPGRVPLGRAICSGRR
jgi:hypothetical protein